LSSTNGGRRKERQILLIMVKLGGGTKLFATAILFILYIGGTRNVVSPCEAPFNFLILNMIRDTEVVLRPNSWTKLGQKSKEFFSSLLFTVTTTTDFTPHPEQKWFKTGL
jgi:hypothetical protein